VLPITGLPFALVGLLPVQVQAGGWFWAEAAGAFALVTAPLWGWSSTYSSRVNAYGIALILPGLLKMRKGKIILQKAA
jgi:hypothetical protein